MPRLLVYHIEALDLEQPERDVICSQLTIMEERLFRLIMNPAMILTLIGGIAMLIVESTYLSMGWMHVKLTLVLLLVIYHHYNIPLMRKLKMGHKPMSSVKMRLFNEIPTLLLVAIVLLAVLKDGMSLGKLAGILLSLIIVLGGLTFLYKRWRARKREDG